MGSLSLCEVPPFMGGPSLCVWSFPLCVVPPPSLCGPFLSVGGLAPSPPFQVPVSHIAAHCQRRLDRISQSGAKKGLRKPAIEEIQMAKVSRPLTQLGRRHVTFISVRLRRKSSRNYRYQNFLASNRAVALSSTADIMT